MRVIKLGGSLMNDKASLIHCLNTIDQACTDKTVIVPGGGHFAEQIRSMQKNWEFNNRIAHQMALLAMQQMALLIYSLKQNFVLADNVSSIQQALTNHSIVIWRPDINELNASKVKASWEVTSDSLAAWLAKQLTATELILVKSIKTPIYKNTDIADMQKMGLVDNAFIEFIENTSYTITVINKHSFNEYFST